MSLTINSGLISSPLWYAVNMMDTFEWNYEEKSGIFYFGSKNQIYFVKLFEVFNIEKISEDKFSNTSYYTRLQYFMKAHHDYVAGLCTIPNGILLPFKDLKLLPRFASCGKDKMIRIWSFNEESGCCCLKDFNLSSTKITTNPTCISINSFNTIFVGFEKGTILSWNYLVESENRTFHTTNEDVVQIAWNKNKFAVAHKKGVVLIFKFNSYDSIQKLTQFRAHNSDVCNVSWNPISTNIEVWGDLATVGKDRKLKLWKTESNLNWKTLNLPSRKIMASENSDDSKKADGNMSAWCSIYWSSANGTSLIVSTGFGNLGLWCNPNGTELKYFSENSAHSGARSHSKSVFGIREFAGYSSLLISHSLDRQINISRMYPSECKGEYLHSMECLGGPVMSMHAVQHQNQLALGCGDNTIRLWRSEAIGAKNSKNTLSVTNIWQGIGGKVLGLSWHPTKEGLLGFGTDSGEVGLLNNKQVTVSRLHHRNKVFVISWGTDLRHPSEHLVVYSVGDYSLYLHDFRNNDYCDVTGLVCGDSLSRISDFAMHSSQRFFAVGYTSGTVGVFAVLNGPPRNLCNINSHSKSVNCLKWHPDRPFCLAIASNERFVSVTELGSLITAFEKSTDGRWSPVEVNECLLLLQGHGDRIVSIDWCRLDPAKIVSVSYDGSALVWSLAEPGRALACFLGHQGRLLSCQWSINDPDLIYSASEDGNVFSWRPSQQTSAIEMHRRRRPQQTILTDVESASGSIVKNGDPDQHDRDKEKQRAGPITVPVTFVKKRTSLCPTTLFAMSHSMESSQMGVLSFLDQWQKSQLRGNCAPRDFEQSLTCMALLGHRKEIMRLVSIEIEQFKRTSGTAEKTQSCLDNYFILLIWIGKTGRIVDDIQSMNYNPVWLTLMVTAMLSQGMPDSIISMLVTNTAVDEKDPILAATYWVCFGETGRALDVLVKHDCLREAVLLAKLRLPPGHTRTDELVTALRDKFSKNGSYELSAVCSVVLGQCQIAVDTIRRRKSHLASWIAIDIARRLDHHELMHALTSQFITELATALPENDASPDEWINKIRGTMETRVHTVLFDVHRALWTEHRSGQQIYTQVMSTLEPLDPVVMETLKNELTTRLMSRQAGGLSRQQSELHVSSALLSAIIGGDGAAPLQILRDTVTELCISVDGGVSVTRLVEQLGRSMEHDRDQTDTTGHDSNVLIECILQQLSTLQIQDQ